MIKRPTFVAFNVHVSSCVRADPSDLPGKIIWGRRQSVRLGSTDDQRELRCFWQKSAGTNVQGRRPVLAG